jgi:serine phosphatase RsbU (regulator of sigma subunit)
VEYETLDKTLAPGDAVVFYTDGLTELAKTNGDMVGEETLLSWVADCSTQNASGILWHLLDRASLFTEGAPPRDDFTIVVIRRTNE